MHMVGNYIIASSLKWWLNRREQQNDRQFMAGKCPRGSLCFIGWRQSFSCLLKHSSSFPFSLLMELLCMHAYNRPFHRRDSDPSERDLLRVRMSYGKLWQLFCTGHSCPCPGSVTQDSHLQPTCQRAAANMVADNWWGKRAGVRARV